MYPWILVVAILFVPPTPSIWPGMSYTHFFETEAECQIARTLFSERKVKADSAKRGAKVKEWKTWCLAIVRDTEI